MAKRTIKIHYDCSKCPGYCCSYPRIEVKKRDIERLAKHFELSFTEAKRRFTKEYKADEGTETILRHQKDDTYGTICRFFDTDERRCTIYTARPGVCRDYPNGSRCGYYEFIKFERSHQDDEDFVPNV